MTSPSWPNAVSSPASSSSASVDLDDADRRAEPRGLDEHREPERGQLRAHRGGLGLPARLPHRGVADLRHAGGGQDLLEDDLVHAQRRREHARADVGHVEQLEQALHGPVLAERAVQHREGDVGAEQAAAGLELRAAGRRSVHAPERSILQPLARRGRPRAGRRPPRTPSAATPRARTTGLRPGPRPSCRRPYEVARRPCRPGGLRRRRGRRRGTGGRRRLEPAHGDRHLAVGAALRPAAGALRDDLLVLRRVGDRLALDR